MALNTRSTARRVSPAAWARGTMRGGRRDGGCARSGLATGSSGRTSSQPQRTGARNRVWRSSLALVSVITVVELTKQMTITAVDVRSWVGPGLLCAALYFAMSYPLGVVSRRLERKLEGERAAEEGAT